MPSKNSRSGSTTLPEPAAATATQDAPTGFWLKIYATLREHPKLFELADHLDMPTPHVVGHLVTLWLWCIGQAPDGALPARPRAVARAAGWERGDPEAFVQALVDCGWLDECSGRWYVHHWEHYGGKLEAKRRDNAARMKEARQVGRASKEPQGKPSVRRKDDARAWHVQSLEQTRPQQTRADNTNTTPSDTMGESEGDGQRPEGGGGDDGKEEIRELLLKAGSKMQEDWKSINPLLDGAWLQQTADRTQGRATRKQLGIIIQQTMEEVRRRLAMTDPNIRGYVQSPRNFAATLLINAVKRELGAGLVDGAGAPTSSAGHGSSPSDDLDAVDGQDTRAPRLLNGHDANDDEVPDADVDRIFGPTSWGGDAELHDDLGGDAQLDYD